MNKDKKVKQSRFRQWKSGKKWLYSATALALLVGGGFALSQVSHVEFPQTHVSADVVNATQIGTVNGQPVVKAQSNDMTSASFQGTVDGLLASANLDGAKYVADNIGWQADTTLYNGQALSTFGTGATFPLGQDGFQKSDLAIHVDLNQGFLIKNVGTITDTTTGEKIKVNLNVVNNGFEHGNDGQTNQDLIFGVRNEGGTLTFGAVTPVSGTNTGGGQSENGGGAGGAIGDGSMVGFINKVRTTVSLVRSDNGQEIPNNELLMAMKVSDVDANQLAEVDANGALGYIVSPDTALSVSGNGLRSDDNGAVITDSPLLTSNSYVVLKHFNSSLVDFTYLDGKGDHMDIVWALFGYLPFKLNVTGDLQVNKTGVESGANMWNGHYTLKGNTFTATNKKTGKVYTAVSDEKGKAFFKGLPIGMYGVKETISSNGFINSFKEQTIEVKQNAKTAKGYNEVSGDNQEIKGENELLKLDKDTSKAESQGKAELKGAEYKLVYLDDSTGSSPHKKGDTVKWSDNPKAKLISGEKVTESVIGGKKVSHGDNIVVRIDGTKFNAYVGNLASGEYAWEEINAPIGYASDKEAHKFEIKKKDDKTQNIITPQSKSLEQVIKAKISIQKKVEISGESAESGFNDIKFNLTPINDTKADTQTITTGIRDDEDGYANVELVYGDWKLTEDEATAPKGYDLIKPIYIQMTTDPETDIITISASYHEDFSKPFSTRTFSQSDNTDGKNENIKGTVAGSVSSDVPFISLSKINLTDKDVPTPPETPSIDIEKSNEKIPQAGQGNNSDKDNNLGKGDADTKDTAVKLTDKAQAINFRVTNNGTETLTHIKLTDKTIEGKQDVKDIKWTYQGKALIINQDGEFELDSKLLELPVDDYIEATGTLDKLADSETHADEATVSAKGAISGKDVGDKDKWYGEKPKTPAKPKIPETPTPAKPSLPMTGEAKATLVGLIGAVIVAVIAFLKHKEIAKALGAIKSKIKK
ncbi:MAG: SpaA isopeptide-forming pilin-related protein [Lactococcus raffinolactis]